jgi:hypothetical protein
MCLGVNYEKKYIYIFSTLHKSLEDKNEFEVCNVATPDPYVLGRPDPDPLYEVWIRIFLSSSKNSKKKRGSGSGSVPKCHESATRKYDHIVKTLRYK